MTSTKGGLVEFYSLHSVAGAVVAVVRGAVLHAVVPIAYVLEEVHLHANLHFG